MNEIDDQEELKKESEKVKKLLEQVKKTASDLETSFETMVIEAFGMDETASSIQEASWKIKWALGRIDLALERMNETKYTVRLDDKSVLEVNDLHRGLISDQKLALEEYKLEQKELFAQYNNDLKSIAAGQGLWLSSKALAVVLVVFELLLVIVGVWYSIGRSRSLHRSHFETVAARETSPSQNITFSLYLMVCCLLVG